MKFASICLLAYKRPEQLVDCLSSLKQNTSYPYEVIVNLDADDSEVNQGYLYRLLKEKKISKLIMNAGKNRGVGRSFANCVGVAEGDFIVKCDTDITFKQNWLSKCVEVLEKDKNVAAISPFNYRNYDPNDTRFNILSERWGYSVVDDFVSSVYVFRRQYLIYEGWQEDDGFHQKLKVTGDLAITKQDYIVNSGFGVLKSTYVSGTEDNPRKTETHNTPLIYGTQNTD